MRQARSIRLGVTVVFVAVALAACVPSTGQPTSAPTASDTQTPSPTPTPTPTPTAPPPIEELVLTTEGLGTLTIGEQPAAGLPASMVIFDPDACYYEGSEYPVGSPEMARWRANYPGETPPFGVGIGEDGVLTRIDLFTSDIPTDSGLRRDGSIDDLIASNPDHATPALTGQVTAVWVIPGVQGKLLVEAMTEDYSGYVAGQIVAITLIEADAPPFGKYGSDNVAGGCL